MTLIELTVPTAKADNHGTWFYLPGSEEKILVAVDVDNKVKPGTLFGPDLKARRASGGKKPQLWQTVDNAYKARRMYKLYVHGWVTMQLSLVRDLNQLALLSLAATYGNAFISYAEFVALSNKLQPLLTEGGEELLGTNNKQVRKARDLIRKTSQRDGPSSRKRLGYTSAAIRTALRAAELLNDEKIVVSLGTVIDQYIGTVIERVRELLPELEEKKAFMFFDMFKPATRDYFGLLAAIMKDLFVVRPFVNPGLHCVRDATDVARIIEKLRFENEEQQKGAMEGLRKLVNNIIDAFKLLVWQYELESLIAEVSDAVKHRTVVSDETWNEWITVLRERRAALLESLGRGFENNVLLEINTCLSVAFSFIPSANRQSHLARIKKELVRASDWVGSKPPKNEEAA
ncbi:TPA: hypothetical protein DEP96_00205 [Candidatus Uhrbacteria bacterium]|nr:hypothetical protein [Candidatus Uhrbacteria bacterium]